MPIVQISHTDPLSKTFDLALKAQGPDARSQGHDECMAMCRKMSISIPSLSEGMGFDANAKNTTDEAGSVEPSHRKNDTLEANSFGLYFPCNLHKQKIVNA